MFLKVWADDGEFHWEVQEGPIQHDDLDGSVLYYVSYGTKGYPWLEIQIHGHTDIESKNPRTNGHVRMSVATDIGTNGRWTSKMAISKLRTLKKLDFSDKDMDFWSNYGRKFSAFSGKIL